MITSVKSRPADFNTPDVFAQAKGTYRISDLWTIFGFPGNPGKSCKSPFREDKNPSFSIYEDGQQWKDHATDDGGDVIEFIKFAIDGSYAEVRDWLYERLGIDEPGYHANANTRRSRAPRHSTKRIEFPGELIEGTEETWSAFARNRGYTAQGVTAMVKAGLLRFMRVQDKKCFVVLDHERRAAEIRRIDGTPFYNDNKAFPLKGVDKSWLVGSARLRNAPADACVLVTEGATDLLTALDLYHTLERFSHDKKKWISVALLGANCRNISPECASLIEGRHVRLIPDDDEAGVGMAAHWQAKFYSMGCTVDTVAFLPIKDGRALELERRPNDLSDVAGKMVKLELAKDLFA